MRFLAVLISVDEQPPAIAVAEVVLHQSLHALLLQ